MKTYMHACLHESGVLTNYRCVKNVIKLWAESERFCCLEQTIFEVSEASDLSK